MSAAAPAIEITRLPGERGGDDAPLLACGGCGCCCCCCCLHSVGGVIGALAAGAGEPVPVSVLRGQGEGPGSEPAALAAHMRRVLGAFALFRAAEELRQAGQLVSSRFERVAGECRLQAQRAWDELYPGRRPQALEWLLERLNLMVAEGVLPSSSEGHFERVLGELAEQAAGVGGRPPRGPLAHLWRIHVLYQEIQAAAAAEAVPARSLGEIRRHLFDQVLQVARDVDAYEGDAARGRFTGEVLDEARELLRGLGRGHDPLPPQDLADLRTQLEGQDRPTPADVEGACKICGDALSTWALVRCAACETPHHQGCWEYNGRCATFACGCTTHQDELEDPDQPLAFDLAEGRDREREAWPGARAALHFWGWCGILTLFTLPTGFAFVLFLAPAIQLVAVLAAMLSLLYTPREGRAQARAHLGKIAAYTFTGTVLGIGAMVVGWPLLMMVLR